MSFQLRNNSLFNFDDNFKSFYFISGAQKAIAHIEGGKGVTIPFRND